MKTFTNLIKRASLSTFNKKRYYLFVIMLLTLGIGQVWAAEYTIKAIDGFKSSYYETETTFEKDGVTYGYLAAMYNANNTPSAWYKQQLIQCRKHTETKPGGDVWNVTPLNISKVIVKLATSDKDFTLYYGSTVKPTSNSIAKSSLSATEETITYSGYVNKAEAPGKSLVVKVYTFDLQGTDASYFLLDNGTSANYIWEIIIQTTDGGATPDPVDPTVTFLDGNYTVGGTLNLSTLWTSNSDGTVTYTVVDAGTTNASISGTSFSATAAGTCTVQAEQTATSAYNAIKKTATITVTAPTPAEIVLSAAGEKTPVSGKNVGDSYTLPTAVSQTCGDGKIFVGWSTVEISTPGDKPTTNFYEPGTSITLAESQTFYAVYATEEGGSGSGETKTITLSTPTTTASYKSGTEEDNEGNTWTYYAAINNQSGTFCFGLNSNSNNYNIGSPIFDGIISSVSFKAYNGSSTENRKFLFCSSNATAQPTTGDLAEVTIPKSQQFANTYTVDLSQYEVSQFYIYAPKALGITDINVTYSIGSGASYSDYSTTCAVAPDAPEFSVEAGTYKAVQTVTITAEDGAAIYYTLDGNTPTDESDVYSTPLTISETTTLKAIAIKDGLSSATTSATYTINLPLTTIEQIFAKATEVGGTATAVEITMGDWVVSGANAKNVFVTDGEKGFIIYKSDEGHGFETGNVLSGTVACKVQLFKGSAELTQLTSTTEGLTVTTSGTVNVVELDADGISNLTGVNTGSLIKVNGICTSESSKYYVAGVQVYTSLYDYGTLEVGAEYNVTGIYQQYNSTKEILPRQASDIEKIESLPTATISVSDITLEVDETKTVEANITPDAAKTTVVYSTTSDLITISGNTITGVAEGEATVTATIAEKAGEYYGATKTFTVTVKPKSTKDKVVVLAKYDGQWYAMMAQYVSGKTSHLAALPVDYVGGKLYNVSEENKALIEWTRGVVNDKATFSNNSKYLTGNSEKTDLTLAATACEWTIAEDSYLQGERTFFYSAEYNWFRNFKIENVDAKDYSGMPVVTAPVYTTGTLYTIKATAEIGTGTVTGAGVYVAGDKVTLTADPAMDYTFVSWTKGGEVVSTANPFVFEATENVELVANFRAIPERTTDLTGTFSVGQYEVAQFATGNLQYNVKDEKWSFAKQQYQYIGDANINVGDPNYKGWIDMFGWSTNETNYGVDPRNVNEFYDGEFVDWGNIEELGDGWSTLSADQWKYLLNTRPNASSLKQIARVGSVVGIMLFPDVWNAPLTVTAQYDDYFEVNIHNYTLDQWTELEAAGALFLPAAGRRTGGYGNMINYDQVIEANPENLNGEYYRWQDNTNIYCYYWTSTINKETKDVSFLHNMVHLGGEDYTIGTGSIWGEKGRYGQSVRLAKVTDVTPETYTRTTGVNNWGTICLPYASSSFTGATFYEVSSLVVGEGLWLDQLADGDQLVAGKPYIFQATATKITVTYTGEAVGTPIAGVNGLTGTFTDIADGGLTGNYIIAENKVWVAGANTSLPANRAYIANTVPTTPQAQIPGRRRVCMGENQTTGLDNIANGENTTIKVIENGQLIIIRNGEKFNAQGVRF